MTDIDYRVVLEDLEAKRAELDAAIAGIRTMLGMAPEDGASAASPVEPPIASTGDIPTDAFFRLSISKATKKYLEMVKKPRSTRDIADALIAGGYTTTSKNFWANVASILRRDKRFAKVGKEWGMAEWYPAKRKSPASNNGNSDENEQD